MKPIMQTKFTDELETVHGNCFAACVASLLELSLGDVPAFEAMGSEWGQELYRFLTEQGYVFQGSFYPPPLLFWPKLLRTSGGVDGFFIALGTSPRLHVRRGHAVIMKNNRLAHDPHPSGDGLTEIQSVLMIRRIKA